MDNQNLNDNNSNLNEVNVQEKAPSLMRETLDENGNVISPTNNFGPDAADKTINAIESILETEDYKQKFSSEEVKKYKNNSMLCYIPIISLYFIIANKIKESLYLRFHANQGLIVTIMWAGSFLLSNALKKMFFKKTMLLNQSSGWVGWVSFALYSICFIVDIFGIINTYNESSKEIPLLGKIKLLKGL